MANYHEYKCLTCGQIFEYCRRCVITPVVYHEEGFCSEKCSHIFNVLSKHGCNIATAEETLEALKDYDVSNVTEPIKAHIDSLNKEDKKEVIPTEDVEVV